MRRASRRRRRCLASLAHLVRRSAIGVVAAEEAALAWRNSHRHSKHLAPWDAAMISRESYGLEVSDVLVDGLGVLTSHDDEIRGQGGVHTSRSTHDTSSVLSGVGDSADKRLKRSWLT